MFALRQSDTTASAEGEISQPQHGHSLRLQKRKNEARTSIPPCGTAPLAGQKQFLRTSRVPYFCSSRQSVLRRVRAAPEELHPQAPLNPARIARTIAPISLARPFLALHESGS